jgi:hypothetical protein
MSIHQNAGQNHNIETTNRSFENIIIIIIIIISSSSSSSSRISIKDLGVLFDSSYIFTVMLITYFLNA